MAASVRKPASVRRAGPYQVSSRADGTLIVTPAWPNFRPYTPEDGGGPGVFSRLGLAHDFERWLNNESSATVTKRHYPGFQNKSAAQWTESDVDAGSASQRHPHSESQP